LSAAYWGKIAAIRGSAIAGIAPIQYTFNLLAIGQGQPTTPKTQRDSKTTLNLQTARGTYYIKLFWEPKLIEAGNDTKFGILFMDKSQSITNDISYSFLITNSNGTVLKDVKDQKALYDNGTQIVKFDKGGPVDVLVSVDAVSGGTNRNFLKNAKFCLIVTSPVIPS
jgi:hypothetical protein